MLYIVSPTISSAKEGISHLRFPIQRKFQKNQNATKWRINSVLQYALCSENVLNEMKLKQKAAETFCCFYTSYKVNMIILFVCGVRRLLKVINQGNYLLIRFTDAVNLHSLTVYRQV